MERIFLWATALVFIGFGVWGLFSPSEMTANFGLTLDAPDAKTMIRASYGGFLIGEGLLFAWCARSAARTQFGLTAVVILTAPILISRIVGIVLDGAASPYHKAYVAIELLGVGLAIMFLRKAN
jgi:nitrate reductase gamma subunit